MASEVGLIAPVTRDWGLCKVVTLLIGVTNGVASRMAVHFCIHDLPPLITGFHALGDTSYDTMLFMGTQIWILTQPCSGLLFRGRRTILSTISDPGLYIIGTLLAAGSTKSTLSVLESMGCNWFGDASRFNTFTVHAAISVV